MTYLDPGQVIKGSYDEPNHAIQVKNIAQGFITEPYDSIALTYIASGNGAGLIGTATYSNLGTPIATLTLTYDGSNRLSLVARS
jgi:hypothetical protein